MPAWMGLSHGGFRGGRCSKSDGEGPFSVVDKTQSINSEQSMKE